MLNSTLRVITANDGILNNEASDRSCINIREYNILYISLQPEHKHQAVLLKKSERFLQYVLEWIEISSPQEPIIFKESSTFTSSSTRAEAMAIRYIIKKIFDIYWLLYSKFRIVN
ncbi:uncharacterized protein OCT59_019196 [Rhizophagus irregularis]|uniref:uncharacterized protein n=1 Tax=Rhizophagus irregularis TaxID=588596 RepID=UPI00332A39BD|nr:hypothetical protein OCT59_019196 [Rhizophagus irregularis]